jgi:hypothetical protein
MRTRERLGGVRDHPGRYPPPLGFERSFRGSAGGAGGRRYAVSRGDAVALTEAHSQPETQQCQPGGGAVGGPAQETGTAGPGPTRGE